MFRNPSAIAIMVTVLAVYVWYVVDLPLLSKVVTVLLSVGAFLLATLAIEKLRDRYGVDLEGQ